MAAAAAAGRSNDILALCCFAARCSLTTALMSLVEGGPNAAILQMEKEVSERLVGCTHQAAACTASASLTGFPPCRPQTFGAAGAPPNPDLAALVASPTPGSGLLYPISE